MSHRAIVAIALARLIIGEPSARHSDEKRIKRMSYSLRSTGQLQPLTVRPIPGTDNYEIITGAMRSLALRMAGQAHADCIVVDREMSQAELDRDRWTENFQRFDPNIMEGSRLICRFMEASGLNGTETAKELGISMTEVSRAQERVHAWCPELQAAVESEKIPVSTAHAIHKIEDPEKQREAIRLAAEGRLTRDTATCKAHEEKNCAPPANQAKVSRLKVALESGAVTISGTELTPDTVVGLLSEFLKRARKLRSRGLTGDAFARGLRDASPRKKRGTQNEN